MDSVKKIIRLKYGNLFDHGEHKECRILNTIQESTGGDPHLDFISVLLLREVTDADEKN